MEQKDKQQLITALIGVGVLLLLVFIAKPSAGKKTLDNGCPIFYTPSQHGDINLPVGTILGYPAKSGENLYDIIRDDTFIMSAYFIDSFKKDFRCFETEEEAVAMGYKKFLSNQAARKEARAEARKFLDEQRGGGNATDTAKTLQSIDALLGL